MNPHRELTLLTTENLEEVNLCCMWEVSERWIINYL